jgi:hypothetical protein
MSLITSAENDVRAFASQYPTPNVLHAVSLCEAGTITWESFAALCARALRAGQRWEVTVSCLPGATFQAGFHGHGGYLPDYAPGARSIELAGRLIMEFIDRFDSERPYGPDGPTSREALEMALDTFAVENHITSITWADPD